jgi:hypothetical protein
MTDVIRTTNKYQSLVHRRIYEKYHGPIPIDLDGRTYEIHHIDGNHNNNDPSNLKAVTIQEHYNIHYAQGDWLACSAIAVRMDMSPEEISELSRQLALKRVQEGTHPFLNREKARERALKRVADGNHNFQGDNNPSKRLVAEGKHNLQGDRNPSHRRVADGTHNFLTDNPALKLYAKGIHPFQDKEQARARALKRVEEGTNPLVGGHVQRTAAYAALAAGTHPSQVVRTCPHCSKVGRGPFMKRYHMDNCKHKEAGT